MKLFCLLMLGVSCITAKAQVNKNKKPNVVIILTDQWRGTALGYLGKEKVKMPNIDAFAKESLTISQMVANYPVCSPSRAMLLTGTYTSKNKVYCNVNSDSAPYGVELPGDITCWSDILKANGYFNGYIGKWHLDSPHQPYIRTANNQGKIAWNEWTPFDKRHGFDYWYAYGTYDYHSRPMYWDNEALRDDFHYVDQWGPEHEADKAIDFFNNKGNVRKEGVPFSLVVSINPPHEPYNTAPAKYNAMYRDMKMDQLVNDPNIPSAGTPMGDEYRRDIKNYYASITGVDDQIGRIIGVLKEKKLLENTIVLITADHGNCLGKHDEHSKNNIYEESLRIPFIIYWKGKIKPGIDKQFLGSMPDVFPTLLELTGDSKSIPQNIDGKSFASYLLNTTGSMPTEQFIMGSIASSSVLINSGFRGIRTIDYKLAYQKKGKSVTGYLFDLKNDPFELQNLYSKDNEKVKLLRSKLVQWLEKTNDGFVINPL